MDKWARMSLTSAARANGESSEDHGLNVGTVGDVMEDGLGDKHGAVDSGNRQL
jgi:hypothetical protein